MKTITRIITIIAILILSAQKVYAQTPVSIYYNQACSDCLEYVEQLTNLFEKYGINTQKKDYINEPKYRAELNTENKKYDIPIKLQDSLTVFLKPNLITEGHVPQNIIENLLQVYSSLSTHKLIILYQPEMHSKAKDVYVYINGYQTQKVSIDTDFVNYINSKKVLQTNSSTNQNILIPLVAGAISNSLHPCAIAVLLLLLTFLYTTKKNKREIIAIGLSYTIGIFIVYFLVGIGILKAISLSSQPFFVAKIASVILVFLGLINIKDYFFPELPVHLKIPDFTKNSIQKFMEKASAPTAFIVGALVGLCAFPCTGGIYTVIISTLAATRSAKFLLYLIIYNLIFILPLLAVVAASTNKNLLEKIENLQQTNSKKLHLITGIFMIVIGLAVFFWIALIIYA